MAYTNTRDVIGDQATLDGLVANTLTELVEDAVSTATLMSNSGIVSITFPNLISISREAFASCANLTTFVAPSATTGADVAFRSCAKLTNIDLPMMTTLGQSMFMDCKKLSTVDFPNAINVASSAFRDCISLRTVSFPNAITVYTGAFTNAPIKKLVLPKATELRSMICYGNGAYEVDLAAKATIYANTFAGDTNLYNLILRNSSVCTLPNVNALASTPIAAGYGTIYVPSGLVSTYLSGTNWATYQSMIKSLDTYTNGDPAGGITDTWAEIFSAEQNGTYSTKYHIGDLKWLSSDKEYYLMQIVAMDTDELADESGNAKITWLCKGVYGNGAMNSENTSSGDWSTCSMRTYLRESLLPSLDATVRSAIKEVKKTYQQGGSQTTHICTDTIWIPSAREVGLSIHVETSGCVYAGAFPDMASRAKSTKWTTNNSTYWWTRSASGKSFAIVQQSGNNASSTQTAIYGIVFGFCT